MSTAKRLAGRARVSLRQSLAMRPLVAVVALACAFYPARAQAQRVMTNTATASYRTPVGVDTVRSQTTQTVIVLPQLSVDKFLDGANAGKPGDLFTYRIRYSNASQDGSASDVSVVDSLPTGLEYVSSPVAGVASGSAVTWTIGSVPAGTTAEIPVIVRVSSGIRDTIRVRNHVTLLSRDVAPIEGLAPEVSLIGAASGALAIQLNAEVLEVGMGEAAPFKLVMENTGSSPVADLQIAAQLPSGTNFVPGSAAGADSARAVGSNVIMFLPGSLAPGTTRTIRFAIVLVSTKSPTLSLIAQANGDQKTVESASAKASVKVSLSSPMATRTGFGKIWIDVNGDGRQSGDEPGVPGVSIWTDDGDVATTDAAGRFSFRNLRPGSHTFRVDPLTLPPDLRVAGDGPSAEVAVRNSSGWTSPRIDFRVVPASGSLSRVQLSNADTSAKPSLAFTEGNPNVVKLPIAANLPKGTVVGILIAAPEAGWPGAAVFPLDSGWTVVPGSASAGGAQLADPEIRRGRTGGNVLLWKRTPSALPISVSLRRTSDPVVIDTSAIVVRQIGSVSRVQLSNADTRAMLPITFTEGNPRVVKLPIAANLPKGTVAEILIAAPQTGWPGAAVFPLDSGWTVVPGSASVGGVPVTDPEIRRTQSGAQALLWKKTASALPITVSLRLTSDQVTTDNVSIVALRSNAQRAAEKRSAIINGPGVAIFAPVDGTVFKSDRIFVGVRGEPGMDVALFDGDSLLANGPVRVDGIHDFIAVRLSAGPHRLRAQMKNSWGSIRWDSASVHVSGLPASFAAERDVLHMVADGQTMDSVRIRVLDHWNVPVSTGAMITVSGQGASVSNADADPSSVGTQLRTDPAGWITVALKPDRDVRRGKLAMSSGDARGEVPLEILPAARQLMVTGSGQVGVGAAPGAFGSLSAVGRIDDQTRVTLNYDSRRVNAGSDVFGRASDPLDPAQYPLMGDASDARTENTSRYSLAARIERGFDWITLGDVTTNDFASGLALAGYRRALPGAAARITTGPLTVQAFGSSTSQTVRQEQIRGQGISGPYQLASAVVPGTELINVETRALDNTQRLVSRQTLARFVDYEIDYDLGTLLLKRPLPASDTYGNPVYLVVTLESAGSGPRTPVWGVRATSDAARLLRLPMVDSVLFGGLFVQDNRTDGEQHLSGADLRLVSGSGLTLGAEFSQSHAPDSSGVAGAVTGSLGLFQNSIKLRASWMRIGDGFANPANLTLRSGTSELTLGAKGTFGGTELKLEHEQQTFESENVSRDQTIGSITQPLRKDVKVETSFVSDSYRTLSTTDASQAGEVKLSWATTPAMTMWSDARRQFSRAGGAGQPDFVGVGASYKLTSDISLEMRHRQVYFPGDTAGFGITNIGLRGHVAPNTDAWGSYQIAGVGGSHNAAIVGLNNKLKFDNGLALNAVIERRQGVGNASIADPVRALPFLQEEENYKSASLGVELIPKGARYRMSSRGEYRDGDVRSVRLMEFAGDVSLDSSLAVLAKGGLQRTTQQTPGEAALSTRTGGLWGLAFRPAHSEAFNALAKLEYVGVLNPVGGGVLANRGSEARVIGALEGVWAPGPSAELAARIAIRSTSASPIYADSSTMSLRSNANYIGVRSSFQLASHVAVRVESRLLLERTTGVSNYDAAPQLALMLGGVEATAGYRFGNLHDPDFAVLGGRGAFLSVGAAITEKSVHSVASFWRQRLGQP